MIVMVVLPWVAVVVLAAMLSIERINAQYQKERRKIDNEYVQHYIHVVVTYRKWKKDVLELKAMLRDCYWDSHRKPILKMINQGQKRIRMLRNLLNEYYFYYNPQAKQPQRSKK